MAAQTGTIVFFDLVGFSTNPDPEQVNMAQSFMEALRAGLQHLWEQAPSKAPHSPTHVLPTGDGAAVVLWDKAPAHPRREYTALWLAGWTLAWAHTRQYGLRCGIATGELDHVQDPYGERNVCGAAINMASRIMDAAHPGQLLVAQEVRQRLSSAEQSQALDFIYAVEPTPYEIVAKHNVLQTVYTVHGAIHTGTERVAFGLVEAPQNKWNLQVEPPLLRVNAAGLLEPKTPPVELLERHKHIAFVGATNDALADSLQAVLHTQPTRQWESLEIFFLTDERLEWMAVPTRSAEAQRAAKHQAIRDLVPLLQRHAQSWALYEYDRPFFFASYWDWAQPLGRIHVSAQIWGADIKDCPGLDFLWRTREPTRAYKAYRDGLQHLRTLARRIMP